ncbi:hypothetical protein [Gordonia sp. ABSL49_1]|uniref:hypothetical protein n=1 Tax=Gordonia sp. ABSL49_1 TaxID=2920941 RepID=UPI001F10384C|nr:hypothetical protein [Gordonia sp. ABSL49_1]MCH5645635.1 hypothetical protein [Gordonia sp. ABSL49_1]
MSVLPQSARRSVRTRTRLAAAIAALGAAVALGVTGCGAGQTSQTANQLPAVNGANANHLSLTLRNVQIIYPNDKADEVFAAGGPFELSFVISSNNPTEYYRLKEIKAPQGGTVTLSPAAGPQLEITPEIALRAGSPVGLTEDVAERATTISCRVSQPVSHASSAGTKESRIKATLNGAGKSVAAGLTTNLTFVFEIKNADGAWVDAGSKEVLTPVDTDPGYARKGAAYSAEVPAEEHNVHGDEHAAEGEHHEGGHETGSPSSTEGAHPEGGH